MKKRSLFALALLCALPSAWSEPLKEIECTLVPIERSKIHRNNENSIAQFSFSPQLDYNSVNWSGYVAVKDLWGSSCSDNTVSQVSGSWVVPTLSPNSVYDSWCAIWVGIDGFESSTVEQTGTMSYWYDGVQSNYVWVELYPGPPNLLVDFPINIGDVFSGSVEYIGNDTFQIQISNLTQGYTTKVPTSSTMLSGTQCNSAEWVVEAPNSGGTLPLAEFSTVTFTNCQATLNGTSGSIDGGWWFHDNVTMLKSNTIEATASDLSKDGTSFQVTWVAP